MGRKIDLLGVVFGRLTVISQDGSVDHRPAWRCQCECGNEITIRGNPLRQGKAQSCGCLRKENNLKSVTIHGHNTKRKPSTTYNSWYGMLYRCTNCNADNYERYGGRGISVCDQWRTFANFLSDMGERPEGKTIDRINNNGNYEPNNCRWATASEQRKNQRK